MLHPELIDRPQVNAGKFLYVFDSQPAFALSSHDLAHLFRSLLVCFLPFPSLHQSF